MGRVLRRHSKGTKGADMTELDYLRKLEIMVLWGQGPWDSTEGWREKAARFRDSGEPGWAQKCGAIADTLDERCQSKLCENCCNSLICPDYTDATDDDR